MIKDSGHISSLINNLKFQDLSPLDTVKLAYLILLQREIDPTGEASWRNKIDSGDFSSLLLIETLQNSPEYRMVNAIPFSQMLHKARQLWIKNLPAFDRILDIGGSSPNIAEGAMIELGYQHRPKELIIFDLPPAEQYWGKPKFPQDRTYSFVWGSLKYYHGRAEKICLCKELEDKEFDLIFMGQVIEHIQPESLEPVLLWINKHLSQNGQFIFDTPNRLITSIQSPNHLIDEDHKIEFTPQQLKDILIKTGFSIKKQWGLLPMPNSFISKSFNPLESYEQPFLSEEPDQSYLFAFTCINKSDYP